MVLLPVTYFPGIVWFYYFLNSEKVLLEKHDHFTKQTFRNRTEIISPNGIQKLVVPVIGGRSLKKQKYTQIRIDYSHRWTAKHLNSIRTAYGSAPFFEFYFDEIKQILKLEKEHLFDLNMEIIHALCDLLNAPCPQIEFTSAYLTGEDLQNTGIKDLRFLVQAKPRLEFSLPPYPQVFEDKYGFVPNVGILDLLFNTGNESYIYLKRLKPEDFHLPALLDVRNK